MIEYIEPDYEVELFDDTGDAAKDGDSGQNEEPGAGGETGGDEGGSGGGGAAGSDDA